jgi:predicted negative regulator of RcsB-dependent stress response
LGGIYGFLGDLTRSVELLHAVRNTAHKREDRLVAGTMLALVYLHHGHPAQARAAYSDAQELFKAGTANPTLSIYRMVAPVIEAELACADGAYERAIALAAAGIKGTRRPTVAAELQRIQGQVLLAQGHLEEAGAALRRARAAAETPDADRMTWLILNILWSRRTVWKSLFAISQLEARRGNHTAAQALLQEAREFVIGLASRSGSPELREAFLSLPDVQAVLG